MRNCESVVTVHTHTHTHTTLNNGVLIFRTQLNSKKSKVNVE